ncbi:MAG TPA: OmpH family outer membrane protein [Syntrophales bacterium]|nr:OmpH family outer membrane protein [Syntrophales bacterium]
MMCLLGAVSCAHVDRAAVARSSAEYKAASQDLVRLYAGATDEASAKASEAQINAATKRERAAEEALNAAMQNLDLNNKKNGKMIENAFMEMQADNEAVSVAHQKFLESQAAAKAWKEMSYGAFVQGELPPAEVELPPSQVELSPALSSDDLRKVVTWIAQEVSNSRQPYCYRDSYGRGVGKPMKCKAGEQEDAGLCYAPCQSGYKGVGPVCWQSCPSGFRDDGAYCAKPRPYGRGVGYPWKFGDGLNDHGMHSRCEKANPQGCEKNGLIYYPKCREGFHNVGCCICSPNCQLGQTDIGVSCQKKSYGRGVGKPLSTCLSSEEKDAWLCYPHCKTGFHGVGPVCWQSCPSGRTDCGVGCSTGKNSCAWGTVNMVTSPLLLAVNIATMGSSSSSNSMFASISKTMKKIADATKDIREAARKLYQEGKVVYELSKTIDMWVNDYVANFENMTNKRVVDELSSHFSGNALLWIKQQYAKNHLTLMLKSDGITTAENVLSTVSAFD